MLKIGEFTSLINITLSKIVIYLLFIVFLHNCLYYFSGDGMQEIGRRKTLTFSMEKVIS